MSMIRHQIDPQAKAVLAYLEAYDGIEPSWNDEHKDYAAQVTVAEWHNCRERGYVVSMHNRKHEQINIAFFEHRNSDQIHAVKWIQSTLNPPTINTAEFGDAYPNKWETSHQVSVGMAYEMAEWIYAELELHWETE